MAVLPTNYLDDILAASMGGKRRFRITHEDGSTEEVTLEDVSEYDQVGSPFGSGDVNKTNQAVNEKLDSADVVDPALATVLGFAADAKLTGDALSELNKNMPNLKRYLTSSDDLNDIKVSGIYSFATDSIPANSPFQNGATVEVISGYENNSTRIIQRITRYGVSGESAMRVLTGGNWLDWKYYGFKNDLIKYRDVELDNQTLESGAYNSFSIDVALSGYTAIGIIQCEILLASTDGAASSYCNITRYDVTGTTLTIGMRNTHPSTNAKIKIGARVLYVKS